MFFVSTKIFSSSILLIPLGTMDVYFAAFLIAQIGFLLPASSTAEWHEMYGYRRYDSCISAITGPSLGPVQFGISVHECMERCSATAGCAGFQYGLTIFKTPSRGGQWCSMKSEETIASFRANGWMCPPTDGTAYGYYLKEKTMVRRWDSFRLAEN